MLDIPEDIIKSASRCTKSLMCLSNDKSVYCSVQERIGDSDDSLECNHDGMCSYKEYSGEVYICGCPLRKAIYRKYNI